MPPAPSAPSPVSRDNSLGNSPRPSNWNLSVSISHASSELRGLKNRLLTQSGSGRKFGWELGGGLAGWLWVPIQAAWKSLSQRVCPVVLVRWHIYR